MSEMNELTRVRREMDTAWSSFVLDGRPPQSIRPEVLRSWHRAVADWRIDPRLQLPRRAVGGDDLLARIEDDEAFQIASPLLAEFAGRFAPDAHTVAFIDASGVILSVDGNHATRALQADSNFAPGACWAEDSTGTNAIGLALIEARPVEVFASEHFVEAWQGWSCASAPVRSESRVMGVVDITTPWAARQPNLLVCAEALARAIEARLDAVAARRSDAIRAALLARGGDSGWLAVDLRGGVVATGPAAKRAGWDARAVRASALAPLLARLAHRGGKQEDYEASLEVAGGQIRVALSPVEHDGRIVGAVVRAPAASARGKMAPQRRMYRFEDILGCTPALQRQVELARVAARNALPVLVVGESGTGKELFAQAIHSASADRSQRPFVAVNCGAIPQSLAESELFGYESGSFTGGRKEGRRGRVEDADGGTLFLDEVSELSQAAQTALLRVLQEREVTRIGSSAPRAVDFRLIAASNKDLREEVRAGRFRQDLYYRLNVLTIEVPPLRERSEDVGPLAEHYLTLAQAQIGRAGLTFAPDARAALAAYGWPGNIRELKNVVERSAVAAAGTEIRACDLPAEVRGAASGSAAPPARALPDPASCDEDPAEGPESEAERAAVTEAIAAASWNVVRAARALGVSRRTMYRRLQKYRLTRS